MRTILFTGGLGGRVPQEKGYKGCNCRVTINREPPHQVPIPQYVTCDKLLRVVWYWIVKSSRSTFQEAKEIWKAHSTPDVIEAPVQVPIRVVRVQLPLQFWYRHCADNIGPRARKGCCTEYQCAGAESQTRNGWHRYRVSDRFIRLCLFWHRQRCL